MTTNERLEALPEAESPEALQALRQHKFGWLTPEGRILACDLHKHFDVLDDLEVIPKDQMWDLRRAEEGLSNVVLNCEDPSHEGFGQWHRYDGARDVIDATRIEIITGLYQKGWIRLGMARLDGSDALCAESEAGHLKRRSSMLRGVAELLDAGYRPEPHIPPEGNPGAYDRIFPSREDSLPGAHAAGCKFPPGFLDAPASHAAAVAANPGLTKPTAGGATKPNRPAADAKKKPAVLRMSLKSITVKPTAGGHQLYILAGTEIGGRDEFMKKAVAFEEVGKPLVDAIKAGGVDPFRILTQVKVDLTGKWAPRKWKSSTGLDKEAWEFKAQSFTNLAVVPLPGTGHKKPAASEI